MKKIVNEYIKGYLKSRNLKKVGFEKKRTYETKRRFDPTINQKIELIQKKDSYSNRSQSGNGEKSVRRTVPLTILLVQELRKVIQMETFL